MKTQLGMKIKDLTAEKAMLDKNYAHAEKEQKKAIAKCIRGSIAFWDDELNMLDKLMIANAAALENVRVEITEHELAVARAETANESFGRLIVDGPQSDDVETFYAEMIESNSSVEGKAQTAFYNRQENE